MKMLLLVLLALGFAAPAQAQMLKQCTIGQHVVDESGLTGVITSSDGAYCNIRLDDGKPTMRMFFVLRPAAAAGTERSGAPLAGGEYDCAISHGGFSHPNVVPMGRFDIQGMRYRFRPLGKAVNGFASYSVKPDGTLAWNGPMGALDTAPAKLTRSYKTPQGFNVVYMPRPGGDADTMSCHHV